MYRHWWFSGRILARGPGSIPGQCNDFFITFFVAFSWYRELNISLVLETEIELVLAKVLLFKSVSAVRNRSFSYDVLPLLVSAPKQWNGNQSCGGRTFFACKNVSFCFFLLPINLHSYWSGRLKRFFCFLVGSLSNNVGDGCENVTYCREKCVRANLIPSPSFLQILANFSRVEF